MFPMKSALKWSFLAVLAVAAAWYVMRHGEALRSLRMLPAASLALLLLLALAEELLQGAQLRQFCGAFGARLGFREWFGLTVCNAMYDYFIPGRAAAGARAYYLKKAHGVTYGRFGSIFVVSNVLNLAVAALVGAAVCLLWRTRGGGSHWHTAALALLGVAPVGALLLILMPTAARLLPGGWLKEKIAGFSGGLEGLLRRADVLLSAAALQLLRILAAAAGFFICCRAVGAPISYGQAALVQSVGAFAILLPLTPAGLGIREGLIGYLSYLVGLPPNVAVAAALIQRAASMLVVFGFGLYYSHTLVRELDDGKRHEDADHIGLRNGGHSAGDAGDGATAPAEATRHD